MKLLSVEDARARMLDGVDALPPERVALARALGRVLAEDVFATRDQPPFAASAMDGWAVRAADGPGARLIIGESAAGHGFEGVVGAGEAVRIFTGAVVPAGADHVVIQEDARRDGERVMIPAVVEPRHVRPAGQDFRAGDVLLVAGVRLDPWRLSLAAAAGRGDLLVARRPRIAILSTGEEVVEPGGSPGPLQIFNSGTTALGALVEAWGGEALPLSPVGDDLAATARVAADIDCDLLVTLGGASVGDHDLVKPALATLGLRIAVESVNIRPGKPTWFGTLGDGRRVLGLPGNPASALVCAELFLRALVRAMQGANPALAMLWARTPGPIPANGPREHWMRARLGQDAEAAVTAQTFSDQDSSLVSVFAEADALLRRPASAPAIEAGGLVEILRLARLD